MLRLGIEVMDGQAAPGHVGRFRPVFDRFDKIAMVELDLEGHALKIFGSEFESGLGQIDPVIVIDPGTEQRPHLACVPTGDVEKGEGAGERSLEGVVEDACYLLVGEPVAVDEFLVGRPLSLELFHGGRIHDGAGLKTVKQIDHTFPPLRAVQQGIT